MKDKSPAVQWYPKQYLGDDKVLAMDWEARGMHHWLLNLSWQQEPVGSIPDDICLVRRWLGLPSGSADADRVWARVWPQIKAAWVLDNGRWFNAGMVRAWQRQQIYKLNGSKTSAKRELKLSKTEAKREQIAEDEDIDSKPKSSEGFSPQDLAPTLLAHMGVGMSMGTANAAIQAITVKSGQPGWDTQKAYLHIIEMSRVYRQSPVFKENGTRYKSWEKWLLEGCYDQSESWSGNSKTHVTDSGQKIDRGYVPLKK